MSDDLKLLQGTWSISALEVEGQKMPASMLASARIVVKGKRFTTTGMGAVYKGTLQLDGSTNPPQVDMKFDAGPEKGNTNFGIYKLKGDTWQLCLATRGTVRPAKFAAPAGSGIAFETLTRGAAATVPKAKPAAKKKTSGTATEFEGEWQMVSGVMSGQAMKKSDVQWVKRVTEGSEVKVVAGPQVLMRMEFKYDATKSPKTIDYRNTAGTNTGKSQEGIYEFDNDLLKICVAAPGSARPKTFESTAGDGRSFTVWKRL